MCDLITCKSLCVSSELTSSATRAGLESKACCSGETILQEHVEICVLSLGACPLCKLLNVTACVYMCVLRSVEIDLDFYPVEIFDLLNPKSNFLFRNPFHFWSSTVEGVRAG